MIGPNVTIATASHPLSPKLRDLSYQFNLPVTIGENCWLGANVTVLPGVTIGDNTVIGAGSLVTKDIPSGVIALGTPAKIIRKFDDHDDHFYAKNREINWENIIKSKASDIKT